MAVSNNSTNINRGRDFGNAAKKQNRAALNSGEQNNNAKPKEKNKTDKKDFKKLDTRGSMAIFTGLYSLFTYFGILSDQIENVVTMGLRHLNNADALTHNVGKKDLPDDVQETIDNAYSEPSVFAKILEPLGRLFGLEKSKGSDQVAGSHKGFDGLITFYARLVQKISKPFFKFLGLKVPFNLPTDIDEDLAHPDYPGKPGSQGKPGSSFDFVNHQDLSLDKDGKAKAPRGHIKAWSEQINPNPLINSIRLKEMKGQGILGKINNFWLMLNHPTTSRQALSLNFGMRNVVEVFLNTIKDSKNMGLLGTIFTVPKLISSVIGTAFQPIGSFMAWVFALTGKKDLIDVASLWALIGSMYVMTGHALENAVKLVSAWNTSKKEGTLLKDELKERGMNWTKIFHGIFGGISAIPAVPGFMARQMQVYKNTRYFMVPGARQFMETMHDFFNGMKLVSPSSRKSWSDLGANFVTGTARVIKSKAVPMVDAIANFAPIKYFLKIVFPVVTDPETGVERIPFEVYKNIFNDMENTETKGYQEAQKKDPTIYQNFVGAPTVDPHAKDLSKEKEDKKNMFMGILHKSSLMMYLYKLLVPFQAWAVVFAYTWNKWTDPEIQKNGNLFVRTADKAIGFINNMLAMPNSIIYGLTARGPQTLSAYYDLKQRVADARGWKTTEKVPDKQTGKEKLIERDYDVMKDTVIPHRNWLLKSRLPLLRFLGKQIDQDIVRNVYGDDVYKDQVKADSLTGTGFYEWLSFDQEYSTEIPTAVGYIRDAFKFMINSSSFFRKKAA